MASSLAKSLSAGIKESGPLKSDSLKTSSSENPEWIEVTISIREYRNTISVYPIGDIKTICKFDGTVVGETCPLPLTDADTHESGDWFTLKLKKCPESIEKLLSLPAILTVYQLSGTFDYSLYEQLMCTPVIPVKPVESQYSVYEAIVGDREDIAIVERPTKKSTKKKISVVESRKSEVSGNESLRSKLKPTKPASMVYGMCVVDFLPLFRGKCAFSETLLIKTTACIEDDGMTTQQRVPTIVIDVSINTPLGYDQHTIAHFTLESIYNLPSSIVDEMSCTAAAHFPYFENSVCGPILFKNPIGTREDQPDQFKCWPNMPAQGDNANTTKYRVNPDMQDVLCKLDQQLDECLHPIIPRLTFNMVKRVLMDERSLDKLSSQAETFKHILVEFYFSEKGVDVTKSIRSLTTKPKRTNDVHCMALVRVSTLILPGETKLRIAVPVKPFDYDDAVSSVGAFQSIFSALLRRQSPVRPVKRSSLNAPRQRERNAKTNMSSQTPQVDPRKEVDDVAMDSWVEFYNETALPVFAIIEIELTKPMVPKLNVEALTTGLGMLVRPPVVSDKDSEEGSTTHLRQENLKVLRDQEEDDRCCENILDLPTCDSLNPFEEVIFNIVLDLQCRFSAYIDNIPELRDQSASACSSRFHDFLDKIGAYTRYNSTIADALVSMMPSRDVKPCDGCNMPLESTDLDLLFRDATRAINRVVNQMRATDMIPTKAKRDTLLFAKEALEMGMVQNGERILLERLCTDDKNADYWFEYTVFLVEGDQLNSAMKCIHEAVMRNESHKYCLVMYGILLEQHDRRLDAETVLMNVVAKEPRWFEGWGVLYLYYHRHDNDTGMEWTFEKMRKLLDVPSTDYFSRFEDLTYGSIGTQQSIPSRLIRFLIKVRMFSWAEAYMVDITEERYVLDVRYLSAVISYYKRDYEECIQALDELKPKVMDDKKKNITALQAHCLANLGRDEEALARYRSIYETYPVNPTWNLLHLVSLKYAKLLTKYPSQQNVLDAKDVLLRFCQCKQSPLTWLLLGYTCYIENDFLRSELCLEKGNQLDNCNGDIWALLAMVNIKLGNYDTADICFNQAVKNGFDTVEYGTEIEMKLKTRAQDVDEDLSE